MTFEPQDLTGALLNQRYRLLRRVGFGGMGTVYATDQVVEGAKVAIKMLNAEAIDNEDVVARFIDEGRLCRRLAHPNLIRIFDVEVAENGCPYLAMELLSGVPLSAYTVNGGKVPLQQSVSILVGILAGLAHAHGMGVVHRDLKPDNVFLARTESGQFYVKVLDFGIAKVMDLIGGMGKRTRTGALLGTPAYMSPEQIRSTKDVDARSDLFSVAVMGYEMLAGRPAFPAPTEFAKLAAVLNSQPPPIESVDAAFAPLREFFQRALQKDRALRFQSADEMAGALEAALARGSAERTSPQPSPQAAPQKATALMPVMQAGARASVLTPNPGIAPQGLAGGRITPLPDAATSNSSRNAQAIPSYVGPAHPVAVTTQPVAMPPPGYSRHSTPNHGPPGGSGFVPDGVYGRLSHLPAVPSVAYAQWLQAPASQLAPSTVDNAAGNAAEPPTIALTDLVQGPGGTLSSRNSRQESLARPSAAHVYGTMPSRDLPVVELPPPTPAGVAHRVVAAFVLLAFGLGIAVGMLVSHALAGR